MSDRVKVWVFLGTLAAAMASLVIYAAAVASPLAQLRARVEALQSGQSAGNIYALLERPAWCMNLPPGRETDRAMNAFVSATRGRLRGVDARRLAMCVDAGPFSPRAKQEMFRTIVLFYDVDSIPSSWRSLDGLDEDIRLELLHAVRSPSRWGTFRSGVAEALVCVGDHRLMPVLEARLAALEASTPNQLPAWRDERRELGLIFTRLWIRLLELQCEPRDLLVAITNDADLSRAPYLCEWALRRVQAMGVSRHEIASHLVRELEKRRWLSEELMNTPDRWLVSSGRFVRGGASQLKRIGVNAGVLSEHDVPAVPLPVFTQSCD